MQFELIPTAVADSKAPRRALGLWGNQKTGPFTHRFDWGI